MSERPKRKDLKPPGKCIFCGKEGDITKQHVWPKWLKKYNLPDDNVHYQVRLKIDARALDAPTSTEHKKQGHSGSQKKRIVCASCNHGWIREIEEAVMTLVPAMMAGTSMVITRDNQTRLAAWLPILTIMAEQLDQPTAAVSPEDRRYLWQHHSPPPNWRMYIAHYLGTNPRYNVHRHYALQLSENIDGKRQRLDTQVSTFVLGKLCLHSFSSSVIPMEEFPSYEGEAVIPIWPIVHDEIVWPYPNGLTDRGVLSLASALIRSIPPATDFDN